MPLILRRIAGVMRRLIGVPDYDRYLDHVRVHHPSEVPLSREEFARRSLEERYSRPGTKCC